MSKIFLKYCSLLFFFGCIHTTFSQGTDTFDKPVYMHYMPWFDSPNYNTNWGAHWTMANKNPNLIVDEITGKREIASHYYPLIGPYDSQDPDVIEYHFLLMKYSGVDGILINWYGKVGTNGDIDLLLENSKLLLTNASSENWNFVLLTSKRSTRTSLVLLDPPVIRSVSPSLKPSSTKSLVPVIVVDVKVTASVTDVLKAAALTLTVIDVALA